MLFAGFFDILHLPSARRNLLLHIQLFWLFSHQIIVLFTKKHTPFTKEIVALQPIVFTFKRRWLVSLALQGSNGDQLKVLERIKQCFKGLANHYHYVSLFFIFSEVLRSTRVFNLENEGFNLKITDVKANCFCLGLFAYKPYVLWKLLINLEDL